MASATEKEDCTHRVMRQRIDHSEGIAQLPCEILEAIFRTLPTSAVVHRVGVVCKDWHSIVKDDELWRLRCGLSELPAGFSSCFAYAQRQTMREQALDILYGRAGVTQNWLKGMQLLSVFAVTGDGYAMALYGWALSLGIGIRMNRDRGVQLLQQSKHVIARAYCTLQAIGIDGDDEEAYRLFSTECDTSDPHVQYMLGRCHDMGFGCKKNKAQAMLYYERAGNHIKALSNLADLLLKRDSCSMADRRRALVLLTRCAEQGYELAQYTLGSSYEHGLAGILEKDIVKAKHWYSLAAENGHPVAESVLRQLNR